ncbi:MAG: hypothetical protein DYG99_15525 [Bacteroidetes bacterium CHB5]|nr:hypothetical protein [Bacteroidetes bacterium CHB5]
MFRFYRLINLLNLDVAAGAVIAALFFSKLLHAPVRLYGIAILGLTVWIIYTSDRLIDVRHLSGPALSLRHKFHQQHQAVLKIAVIVAVVVVCALLVFIRPSVLLGGLILAPLTALYLMLQKKLPIKELAVAVMYSVGVLLPAWPGSWSLLIQEAGLIVQFFFIALANLILFAWFEADIDRGMGQHSLATRLDKRWVTRGLLLLIGGGVGFSFIYGFFNTSGWIFFSMWLCLAGIFRFHTYFRKSERYRLWGDAIFYLPAIGLFMNLQ